MEIAAPKGRRGRSQSPAPSLQQVDADLQEPVERQVYRSLRHALMSGRIAPGATLTSRSIAQQLGVSAQPVRDALKRLEADGILDGRPQSGFYLIDPSRSEYAEITEIRQRLEGLAGRHAAQRISPAVCRKLARINDTMGRLTRPQAYLAENFRFHFTIYEQARRPALLAIIQTLWIRIGPALHHHPYEINRGTVLTTHRRIIDGLERRDGDAVEAAIAHDLASTAEIIIPNLPDRGPASPSAGYLSLI